MPGVEKPTFPLAVVMQRRLPVPLVRVGYRVAYRVAQVAWYVMRPDVHGVKGILRDGEGRFFHDRTIRAL